MKRNGCSCDLTQRQMWNDPRVMSSAGYLEGMNLTWQETLNNLRLEGERR